MGYSIVPLLMARLLGGMGWQAAYGVLGLVVLAVPLLINWGVWRGPTRRRRWRWARPRA